MVEGKAICVNCKEETPITIIDNFIAYKCTNCGVNVFDKENSCSELIIK